MKPVLGRKLVRALNDKHGYFQYADAQGDVSVVFANEAVELFLGLSVGAAEAYEATGLTPSQLQTRVAELEAAARIALRNWAGSHDVWGAMHALAKVVG